MELMADKGYGREAIAQTLGVEVTEEKTTSAMRRAVKKAIAQYENNTAQLSAAGTQRAATAQPDTTEGGNENAAEGTQSVRRDGGRNDGVDSGEQAGGLGESGSQRTAQRRAEGNGQQNNEKALRRQRQKERIKRFERVTETRPAQEVFNSTKYEGDIAVVPEELYTQQMRDAAQEVEDELGVKVIYFKGTLIREDASRHMRRTAGFFDRTRNEIWATVGSELFEPEQLVHHEKYHAYVAFKQADVMQTIDKIMEQFNVDELEALVQRYVRAYAGVYDNESIEDIYEELLADAYAGMNRFGDTPNATQYQQAVKENVRRGTRENERAMRDTRGAPGEKHSLTPDEDIEEENIRNGEEAIKKMSKMAEYAENPENIIIENAMYRSDIGQIDFVWGKPGTGPKFKKGYGISHIIAKHGEDTAWKVVDVIAKGTEYDTQKGNNLQPGQYRLRLFYDNYTVVLSKDTDSKHWVLTAWDNDKETAVYATEEGNGSIGATAATPMLTRRNGVNTAVSKESLSNEGEIVKQKFSFDDEDYLLAVRAGDMDAAQEMVDEAAKAAGYAVSAYHGTESGGFNEFTQADDGYSYWFTDRENVAESYAGGDNGIYKVFLDLGNSLYVDAAFSKWNHIVFNGKTMTTREIVDYAHQNGYDSVQFENVIDIGKNGSKISEITDNYEDTVEIEAENEEDAISQAISYYEDQINEGSEELGKLKFQESADGLVAFYETDEPGESRITDIRFTAKKTDGNVFSIRAEVTEGIGQSPATVYAVFDGKQVKSAETMTYDDNGNVIPLSERFNSEKTDIRYSFEEEALDEEYRQVIDREPVPHRTAGDLKRDIKETLLRGQETKQMPTATVTLTIPESDVYKTETTVTHEYGLGKPFYSKNTTLTPKETIECLEAATGMKWQAVPMKKGLWKAEMTTEELDTVFAPKGYSKYVVEMKERGEKPGNAKQYAQEMLAKAWRDPGAPSAATVHPDGVRKEEFSASPALEKIGVKIDGSVVDYETTQQIRQAEDARFNIQKLIKSTIRRYGATNKEVAHAKSIAEGVDSYFDVPESCRFHVVSDLAGLYMDERMAGNNLVSQRRVAIKTALLDKAIEMFPKEQQIKENPELFNPTKLLTMNYRTPERNMTRIQRPLRLTMPQLQTAAKVMKVLSTVSE